jgi:hypothetical protein
MLQGIHEHVEEVIMVVQAVDFSFYSRPKTGCIHPCMKIIF